jgi:hypothetical protein
MAQKTRVANGKEKHAEKHRRRYQQNRASSGFGGFADKGQGLISGRYRDV